ncbi:MAG: Gfo/Idh/MocA family oxidoreductase [Armatimonadetes bacterium]|nr:Gfo/Idh/MocA family oxidoreductase [Armatimonadota bacterium]
MTAGQMWSRRRVLQGSAVVATAALAGPGRLEAAPEGPRIGFIGVKNRGMQNLGPLIQHAVAVCDVDQTVLAAAQARVEKATGRPCRAFRDHRELLAQQGVDAVVISTPDHWHALQAAEAIQAGKDVYCEKPLTLNIYEGQTLVRLARKHGCIVQTGSQQRSDAKFRLACELVRSGRLGKIHTVQVGIKRNNFKADLVPDGPPPPELDYDRWLGPARQRPYNVNRVHYNFRFFWDYSGGQMTNWGAHHLDIAQWGLGMDESGPVEIEGEGRLNPGVFYETPDWCHVLYRYASGVVMHCGQDYKSGVTFEGDRGKLWVDRGKLTAEPAELLLEPLGASDTRLIASDNHYQNWLESIQTRKLPICDVAIGHRSATVCHLGNIAVRTGKKLRWDPVGETILGDDPLTEWVRPAYRSPWTLP